MIRKVLFLLLNSFLLFTASFCQETHQADEQAGVPSVGPVPEEIVGTWSVSYNTGSVIATSFFYTFQPDGKYDFVGGNANLCIIMEQGFFYVEGDRLILYRMEGSSTTSSGEKSMGRDTKEYFWRIGGDPVLEKFGVSSSQEQEALFLTSDGEEQLFYRK